MTKSKNQKSQRDSSVRGFSANKAAKKMAKKKLQKVKSAASDKAPVTKQPVYPQSEKAKAKKGAAAGGLSAMQEQMKKRLEGGKFRMLNEQLYTTTGDEAFDSFQAEPELFDTYHEGFREMAEKWPANPLDKFIDYVKLHPKAIVADFGCGDARLAASVSNTVHSFDLVSRNQYVVACNIAHVCMIYIQVLDFSHRLVPLPDESVDIAVYCLALMGSTLVEYLLEGRRVLKLNGVVKIAEVKSRFETDSLGGIKVRSMWSNQGFVRSMQDLGFDLKHKDENNKMFVTFEFTKVKRAPKPNVEIELKVRKMDQYHPLWCIST
ncbi:hypothetical protein AaE_011900 [Aphanomyces astaci]|uniref:Ribosomal RNA-processing protein 8 n=1 Tax=Aphanomyces astaci TaxID=112090 RepID=A0A6A4ZKC1_APHAT|nr:hypothetical protein AaE_011900 [Aphanomyces astaci]